MTSLKKTMLLATAAIASLPLVSNAAVLTFSYSSADFEVSTDGGATFTPVTIGGTATAPSVTIPVGAILEIGATGVVTGNPNAAKGDVYDSGGGAKTQDSQLGLASFGFGFTNSNAVATTMDPGAVVVNANFTGSAGTGSQDNLGGVVAYSIAGGNNGGGLNSSLAAAQTTLAFAATTPADLFNTLYVDGNAAGTSVFVPNSLVGAVAYYTYFSGGTSATNRPSYINTTAVQGVDTINNLPALTVIVGSSTGPTGPTSGHSIVQLNSSSPAAASYGGTLATIVVTHLANNGGIVAGYDRITNTGTAVVSGIQPVTGFTATDTPQEFALDLVLPTGGSPTAAQLQTIISDINSASSTDGVVASLIPLNFQGVFSPSKGYDLMLTSTTSDTTPFLGFDFSQETNVAGITVAAVAAVPEPATAVGLLVGAGSLLLGRRKKPGCLNDLTHGRRFHPLPSPKSDR